MNKLKEVLGSQNFLTALISIVLLAFTANNIDVGNTPQEISDMLFGKQFGQIAGVIVLQFFTPLLKIGKALVGKTFDWSFLKSSNFQTNVLTLVSILIGAYFGEMMGGIVMGLIVQIINLIMHLKAPVKG